jgi:hypothetical protein
MSAGVTEPPYRFIADEMLGGRVTAFFGAGINLYGRDGSFKVGERLPDAAELAHYLLERLRESMDVVVDAAELARASQVVLIETSDITLRGYLDDVFACDYNPNDLQRFIARFTPRARRGSAIHQLIVTTNYDSTLEKAFEEIGREVDVFYYAAGSDDGGLAGFYHRRPDGTERMVDDPANYDATLLDRRPTILKIHGAVNPDPQKSGSYVITEDDYVDYLAHNDVASRLPARLRERVRDSHLLFLGYAMRDWNLRAFLHRLWKQRRYGSRAWSIQLGPDALERKFWEKRGVEIFDLHLEDFLEGLKDVLE